MVVTPGVSTAPASATLSLGDIHEISLSTAMFCTPDWADMKVAKFGSLESTVITPMASITFVTVPTVAAAARIESVTPLP